ncbi:hypothetical protein [Dubosiella newyorkensis]|uniref:Initiator Rep protein domain-containing protein n=1 Tax=Dubosiella newyorkensis TaxID=1862672 RepID=A0A1U7NL72_9FIRM|nr:hypothetical protein [Dubosiella newyorkensis]OLU45310.1 hypothetical protein BO225_09220 [Dubosiella newyorkensis]
MSKYAPLWEYVHKQGKGSLLLSFDSIDEILGFEIDHSFLRFKKELEGFGYKVGKISMKNKTVSFSKLKGDE